MLFKLLQLGSCRREESAPGWGLGMAMMAAYGCSQHLVFIFYSLDPPQLSLAEIELTTKESIKFLHLLLDFVICHVCLFLSAHVHQLPFPPKPVSPSTFTP